MTELIKRPDEFYVGFKSQHVNTSSLPLAFLTPYDTTAAFKKRQETVDSWARPIGTWDAATRTTIPGVSIPSKNVKNEPIAGFSIAKSVKRTGSWNGGNVVWRIEDPRGFEWEIPSANLAQIITQTGISAGGIINGRCIIGRLGSNNILIPEGTDLWEQMEADMATRVKKATAKVLTDLRAGDAITLKDGRKGFYLGKRKVIIKAPNDPAAFARLNSYQYQNNRLGFRDEISKNEYHLIITDLTDYNHQAGYYPVTAYKGNPPVVSVDAIASIDILEVDKMLKSPKCYLSFSGKMDEASQDINGLA